MMLRLHSTLIKNLASLAVFQFDLIIQKCPTFYWTNPYSWVGFSLNYSVWLVRAYICVHCRWMRAGSGSGRKDLAVGTYRGADTFQKVVRLKTETLET